MLEIAVAIALIAMYLVLNRQAGYEPQVALASVLMAVYLVVYLYLPPKLAMSAAQVGQIFGLVPAVSFGAILFPGLNPRFPAGITRFLGWLGFLAVFSALGVFKIFIW